MKEKALIGARILFGAIFIVFGINGFLKFMPTPPVTPEAGALLGALGKTGYFFPMIKIFEIIAGLFILTGIYAPLGVVLMTPILVGISTIHIFLNPGGLAMMIGIHALHGFLVYAYWGHFQGVLARQAKAFS